MVLFLCFLTRKGAAKRVFEQRFEAPQIPVIASNNKLCV